MWITIFLEILHPVQEYINSSLFIPVLALVCLSQINRQGHTDGCMWRFYFNMLMNLLKCTNIQINSFTLSFWWWICIRLSLPLGKLGTFALFLLLAWLWRTCVKTKGYLLWCFYWVFSTDLCLYILLIN